MRKVSDDICKEYELQTLEEKDFYKNISNRYARSSKYLDSIRSDIDYAISQARVYNDFTKILTAMGYELKHENNKMSIRKPPYKRYIRVERTFGEEYSKDSILFRIKPNYPPKLSKTMKEEVKKLDEFSNAVRFLGKHHISTLAEVEEYKASAINKVVELKGTRENLWRKHSRVKTNEEKQFICSEIGFLASEIDKLKKDIIVCENIENRALKMRENIKDMSQEENNKVKVKNRDRNDR